ncbi:hypothetical protein [Ulvibacterium sp.]|uniref:hypothetical protein n=1 Tax=Ulvibacterium sp. TaxID=2665914 RepID=UPI003BABCA7B
MVSVKINQIFLVIFLVTGLPTSGQECDLGQKSFFSPKWSKDGKWIAFHSNISGNREIYRFDYVKSKAERLTITPHQERVPVISPDGKSVLFFRTEKDKKYSALFSMNLDNRKEVPLTDLQGKNLDPDWSPDMDRLTYVATSDGNWEIYVMDPNGTNNTRLTYNNVLDYSPHWSPNGEQIAFISGESGQEDIWLMNSDGTEKRNLTPDSREEISFSWSPKGDRIVFSSRKSKASFSKETEKSKKSTNSSEIFILDLKSGQTSQITSNMYLDVYPSWSPDGSKIVFCSCKNGHLELYTMKVDGSSQTKLNLN